MKQIIISSVAVAAMLLLSIESAEAGGLRITFGNTSHRHNDHGFHDDHGSHVGHGLRRVQLRHVGRSFSPIHTTPRWHDTTHLDWHRGEWHRHGGRLIYIPGHYDVHRTGHFDH